MKEIDIAATLEHVRDQRPGVVQIKVRLDGSLLTRVLCSPLDGRADHLGECSPREQINVLAICKYQILSFKRIIQFWGK